MEIEKDVEFYISKLKCKNIKALTAVAYFRYCELYRCENIIFKDSNSVLKNKR